MRWPAYAGIVARLSFVRHKVRQSYISRTVWPRITKLCSDIQADLLYRVCDGCDVTSYFRSAFMEVLENVISKCHKILNTHRRQLASQTGRIWQHELLPVGFKMQLGTAQKCVTGAASIKAHNSITVWHKIESNDSLNTTECLPRM